MPFVLLLAGLLLIVSAVRGTQAQLWNLLYNDMIGSSAQKGFLVWLAAILVIGFLGYFKPLELPSKLLLALVVVGIFVANGGVFQKMAQAFTGTVQTAQAPQDTTQAQLPQKVPVEVTIAGGGGGGGGPLGAVGDVLGAGAKVTSFFAL